MCSDVDECSEEVCSPHSTCSNTIGGYACECRLGYVGNETVCKTGDIFRGLLRIDEPYTPDFADSSSVKFKEKTLEIESRIDAVYNASSHKKSFLGSQLFSLKAGSLLADFLLVFEVSSGIASSSVGEVLNKAIIDKTFGVTVLGPTSVKRKLLEKYISLTTSLLTFCISPNGTLFLIPTKCLADVALLMAIPFFSILSLHAHMRARIHTRTHAHAHAHAHARNTIQILICF